MVCQFAGVEGPIAKDAEVGLAEGAVPTAGLQQASKTASKDSGAAWTHLNLRLVFAAMAEATRVERPCG
jgi:hypothetical protein